MKRQEQEYKVAYRVGVPSRFQWREMFGNLSYAEAKKEAEGILRQGYRAIVHKDKRHGFPATWEAGQSPEDYYERDGWLIMKGGAYDFNRHVVGDDGTILYECDSDNEASRFIDGYTRKGEWGGHTSMTIIALDDESGPYPIATKTIEGWEDC